MRVSCGTGEVQCLGTGKMKLSKADLKWVRRHGGVVARRKLHEQKPQSCY